MIEKFLTMLPSWLQEEMTNSAHVLPTEMERMKYVIDLALRNVNEGTGGPFAAAIFERSSGKVIASGVNLVLHSNCSHAHAEMIAIALAEQKLGVYSLAEAAGEYELVSSCEPCAMCFGAIPWSGVTRVVSGAMDADARAIGFDEGPKPNSWTAALEERGIEVIEGVCREDAAAVMKAYIEAGGTIY